MSTVKKNYFERIVGKEIIRVRNRIQAKSKEKIKSKIK